MKLICPECRRENEPERIYCHDCGARLDRSGLAKEKTKEESPGETQRRLRTMLDPQGALMRQRFFQGSKLVLGALLTAAVVQMVRSPDLPEREMAPMLPAQINLDLENATMDPRVGPLHYNDEQVNAYLAYALKGKQAALSKYLQFERAVVTFDEGFCRVTAERSLFNLPLRTTASVAARVENGKIVVAYRGGSIGRLPVHPALMQYSGLFFADLRAALEREAKLIAKLGSVEFHPKTVFLTPKQP